jgi:hypothetical protein
VRNDDANLLKINLDEMKKLKNLIYNQNENKENLRIFQKFWDEYSEFDLKSNYEDIVSDEILRVQLSSDTINKVNDYMVDNNLTNFNITLINLIENGLKNSS